MPVPGWGHECAVGECAYQTGSPFAAYLGSITSGQGIVNVTSVSELLVLSAAPAVEFPTLAGGQFQFITLPEP